MHVVFLTPVGALAAAAVLLPLGAVLLRERRDERLRRLLRLATPSRRALPALAGAAVVACLAAAAAQPAIRTSKGTRVRTDAQVYYVFDISGSMQAARRAGAPTRFERAKNVALRLRGRLTEMPSGIGSLTDRMLAVLPATADRPLFDRVVERVLQIDEPPPASVAKVATQFTTLADLATQRYFSPGIRHRLAIVLSDGETDYFDPGTVRNSLHAMGVGLIVVTFTHPGEAIYDAKGRPDPKYRPDTTNLPRLQTLGHESVGGRVFDERSLGAVAHAARAFLGKGPTATSAHERRTVRLGPYIVLAGILPLLFLLRRR